MRTKLKKIIESSCTGLDAIKRAPIVDENTGVKCLRIQDVSQSKPFNLWGNTSALPTKTQKFFLKRNDIFIARTGASIGSCMIINQDLGSVFNNGLIRIRALNSLCNPKYLYYLLISNKVQQHIYGIGLASATQPNMKINDLLDYEIDLPSLEFQQHIVNTIGSVDDLIENYEKQENMIIELLRNKIALFPNQTILSDYKINLITSGLSKFNNFKKYLDTSSIEGINKIISNQQVSYYNRPSRANMEPIENSVWFAKMKDSNKILLISEQDVDIVDDCILSTGFVGIKTTNRLPLSVLFSFIVTNDFFIQRNLNSVGTTMAGINNETLQKIVVPSLNQNEVEVYEKQNSILIVRLSNLRRKINESKELKEMLLTKYF